jgi:cytochrome c biogenesis protein CcdA
MRMGRLIKAILLSALLFPLGGLAYSADESRDLPVLVMFYSPGCHRCIKAKQEYLPPITEKFKDRVIFQYRDLNNVENYKLFLAIEEAVKTKVDPELPIFYFEGHFLNGTADLANGLEPFILENLNTSKFRLRALPSVDLVARFKAIKPLVVANAGLIDGINPCAFTVMVFFISFLALQGYRKVDIIAIGIAFIASVFLTYLLVGAGLFAFLYRLEKSFWLASKIFNISIGAFSLALGGFALYDFWKFKRTGKTEGLTLKLPDAVKNQIHKVIGFHYRKAKATGAAEERMGIPRLVLSAFITGFLVSILEAVCTGQTYIPTITFVLKTAPHKTQAFLYLVLYNVMFIVPLLAIFILALFGFTSEQFSRTLKKHLLTIKLLMAAVFISFGVFLIWRA